MLTITGKPVYGAISIGPLALFHRNTISTAVRTITDPEAEVQRFLSVSTGRGCGPVGAII